MSVKGSRSRVQDKARYDACPFWTNRRPLTKQGSYMKARLGKRVSIVYGRVPRISEQS